MSKKNKKNTGTPVEEYNAFEDIYSDPTTEAMAVDADAPVNAGAFAFDSTVDATPVNDAAPAAAPAVAEAEETGVPQDIAASYEAATPRFKGATFKKLQPNGPIPVIAPINPVQLTPIVVPVAIVPYATQNQPMLQYVSDGNAVYQGEGGGQSYADNGAAGQGVADNGAAGQGFADNGGISPAYDAAAADVPAVNGKGSKALAFFAFLFGILTILPAVFGFLKLKISSLDFSEANFVQSVIDSFSGGTDAILANVGNILFCVAVVVAVVFVVVALISLFAKKAPKLFIAGAIMVVFAAAGFFYNMIKVAGFSNALTEESLGYLLTVIFAVVATAFSVLMQVFASKAD